MTYRKIQFIFLVIPLKYTVHKCILSYYMSKQSEIFVPIALSTHALKRRNGFGKSSFATLRDARVSDGEH